MNPGHPQYAAHVPSDPLVADPRGGAVLLYDDTCELCVRSVRFMTRRDPDGRLRHVPLGSPAARRLLVEHGRPADYAASAVLIANGAVYEKSEAMLRALGRLRWPWTVLSALLAVPPAVRDAAYDFIAARRHAWPGACRAPARGVGRGLS